MNLTQGKGFLQEPRTIRLGLVSLNKSENKMQRGNSNGIMSGSVMARPPQDEEWRLRSCWA